MIEDLVVKPLKLILNERGRLMEVQGRDDKIFPGFGQVYVTETLPRVVKAWYRHHVQIDQIAPITGSAELVLYDAREESHSKGQLHKLILEERTPALVQIPVGVWHGFRTLGDNSVFLLHLNSLPYNAEQLDEDRLPWNSSEIPYQW